MNTEAKEKAPEGTGIPIQGASEINHLHNSIAENGCQRL